MKCANCGEELQDGLLFCTNCGTSLSVAETGDPLVAKVDAGNAGNELGASLESAVQANRQAIEEIQSHEAIQQEAAARWAEAEAVEGAAQAAQTASGAEGAPVAPAGFQARPQQATAADQAAQAAPVAVPFYQQDVLPNAHYSSQRTYEQSAYGQDSGQAGYRPPAYGQPSPEASASADQQTWPPQSATNRAFAMTLYVANLLGLIFGLCVRDKEDEFITHHLNNVAIIVIGFFISGLLSIAFIGFILFLYLLVMAIMGIVSAYNGDMKELPLIGKIHIVK